MKHPLLQLRGLLLLLLVLAPAGAPLAAEPSATASATAASTAQPLVLPKPLKLNYTIYGKVSFLPYRANGTLIWMHDEKRYDASMKVEMLLLGSRVQISSGKIVAGGLQPQHFVDRVDADRTVEFDYEQGRIRFSEGAPPEPLPAGAQDHLSVFMQVGALVASAPQRYPTGSEIVLPAMGIYGPETWRFVVAGTEQLNLPGGEQTALRLNRLPQRGDDPRAELWLAPSLGWLPVRIRLSQPNGDYIDQQWRGSEAP